ncbi:MAG TPA: AmmeMemoRadiSam system radical SAM enzyme [Polyangiales bacterium]|nr:AmmeMemoRadiSam system radical SAM enzyme [Polyangiales bacterium]
MDQALKSTVPTEYWSRAEDGRVVCDLCPRECKLSEGQRGLCFVRAREDDQIVLTSYGRSSGFCVDPIEKKPLSHFLPGTPVFSFGTAGCNLTCKFCQNWDISKSRQMDTLADTASPEAIADAAVRLGCRSVAFTYNDPVIFLEYARDVAAACHERDIRTVAVTAGYVNPKPRADMFSFIDAANVDLKAFDDAFYRRIAGGRLQPVLDTLRYLRHETNVWLEITNLIIPGHNDSDEDIRRMSEWIVETLGPHVPLHFSAFHPSYRMRNVPPTSRSSLRRARAIAKQIGIHHVYTGNVHDPEGDTTYCASCGEALIERSWYELRAWRLDEGGACPSCRSRCAGVFEPAAGTWGARRLAIKMGPEGMALS